MKILIARWKFEQLTAGLSPIERERLADTVVFYPEGDEPEWHVDQDRIASQFARLIAGQSLRAPWPSGDARRPRTVAGPKAGSEAVDFLTPTLTPSRPSPVSRTWNWPKGNGKTLPDLVPPWEWDGDRNDWLDLDSVLAEFLEPQEPARRYFLNDWTPAADANPVADILSWIARRRELDLPPRHTLRADSLVIVPDPDIAPNVWRLVDPDTGEVLQEGTLGDPDASDYLRDDFEGCTGRWPDDYGTVCPAPGA